MKKSRVKETAGTDWFRKTAIAIMCVVFIANLILSRDYNILWILLSGGGRAIDYLGESHAAVFKDLQLYRLITYGYTQTAIWHLLANVAGLWYVGQYLEKKIGILRFILVYHAGLAIAGAAILFVYPDSFHYGASPAIFTCLGILASWLLRKRALWKEYRAQQGFSFLLYYAVFSNFLGMRTLLLHLFGFCVGFLLGFVVKEERRG